MEKECATHDPDKDPLQVGESLSARMGRMDFGSRLRDHAVVELLQSLWASTRTMRHGRRVGTFPRIRRRSGRENPSHVIFGGCGGIPFAVA